MHTCMHKGLVRSSLWKLVVVAQLIAKKSDSGGGHAHVIYRLQARGCLPLCYQRLGSGTNASQFILQTVYIGT